MSPKLITGNEPIDLGNGIDLVTSYRIHQQEKRAKPKAPKTKGNLLPPPPPVPPQAPASAPEPATPPSETPAASPAPLPEISIPTPIPAPDHIQPPVPPAPIGMINVSGFCLPTATYRLLRQLQDQFGTATIPATISRLVEREQRAQNWGRLAVLRTRISAIAMAAQTAIQKSAGMTTRATKTPR